jgi:hypothetical protein
MLHRFLGGIRLDHDEVTGLGGFEGEIDGFEVAEDAFDAFQAQRGLEAGGEQAHDFAGFAGFAKAKRLLSAMA